LSADESSALSPPECGLILLVVYAESEARVTQKIIFTRLLSLLKQNFIYFW
jgi:hypothetical protein